MQGEAGLRSQSRCPIRSPLKKVDGQTEALILGLRKKRKLGPKRLRSEQERLHSISLSVSVTQSFKAEQRQPLAKPTWKKAEYIRYCRPIPGERIPCEIAPNLYQYTAIDDCTRCRVLQIYKNAPPATYLIFSTRCLRICRFRCNASRPIAGWSFSRRRFSGGLLSMA